MILDTGIVSLEALAGDGFQMSVCSSSVRVRVPSFFLYEAAPLGGAIVACRDSFLCPGRRQ